MRRKQKREGIGLSDIVENEKEFTVTFFRMRRKKGRKQISV